MNTNTINRYVAWSIASFVNFLSIWYGSVFGIVAFLICTLWAIILGREINQRILVRTSLVFSGFLTALAFLIGLILTLKGGLGLGISALFGILAHGLASVILIGGLQYIINEATKPQPK